MRRATVIGASIFLVVHLGFVTTPVLLTGATGETQGWIVFLADFPLIAPLLALGFQVRTPTYLVISCVLGPLMYAAVGALVGRAVGSRRGAGSSVGRPRR